MDFPSWITGADLGSFSQDYSFDLSPLSLLFSSGPTNTVRLINGSLPDGLQWQKAGNSVKITGVAAPSLAAILARFTFRVTQSNGAIADRTFFITLNPIAEAPSWANQDNFLGYQGNTEIKTYQLVAIPPQGQHVTYSLLTTPTGMSLNSQSGQLTYNAAVITSNSDINFNVSAAGSNAASDIALQISVVISPLAPRWVTDSGSIGTYAGEDFIEFNLEATDVTGATVTYTLSSFDSGFPLSLSSDGLLYGRPSNPLTETLWNFTVQATSVNGTTSRVFSLSVLPSELFSLLAWQTDSELGIITEAEYAEIFVTATTRRNTPLLYNISGGLPPPHLMIDRSQGKLIGFIEFTAVTKTYHFDITVTDGYQSLTKTFSLTVKKKYGNQYFGAYIPITGDLRQQSLVDIANVRVRTPGAQTFNSVQYPIDPPSMSIINGLVTGYSTADQISSNVSPWLHTLDLQFGSVGASTKIPYNSSMLYRNIQDSQSGSNASVYSQAVYNTNVQTNGIVYPISIDNLRYAFSLNNPLVLGGSGNGAVISPVLDWTTGALSGVQIINSGSGYLLPPETVVNGSGQGAEVRAILGLADFSISGPGRGWAVGDVLAIPGIANTYAELTVSSVGTNGSVSTANITVQGDYSQVSASSSVYISNGDAYVYIKPTWGIVDCEIINQGTGYQCGIAINTQGGEILPKWQLSYYPILELGKIPFIVGNDAAKLLNTETNTLWGTKWDPNYIVFQWQGIKWLGTTSFDQDITTFDGGTTNFEETEDSKVTVFDSDVTIFDSDLTVFDTFDPLTYDLQQVWGSTLIDSGTTVFDLYATIFDELGPRLYSNTRLRKWLAINNRIYSGNNVVR